MKVILAVCALLRHSRLYPQFKYMTFIYSLPSIHHFTGLFRTTIMTSSAPVSQKSWVQIPYRPEFFSGLIFTTAYVVHITARITFIHVFIRSSNIWLSYILNRLRLFWPLWLMCGLYVEELPRKSTMIELWLLYTNWRRAQMLGLTMWLPLIPFHVVTASVEMNPLRVP